MTDKKRISSNKSENTIRRYSVLVYVHYRSHV